MARTPMLGKTWEIRGLDQLRQALAKWGQQGAQAGAAALYQEAEKIMSRARSLTPVGPTGNLRASGHVEPPVFQRNMVSVALGFGGAASGYAVYVHENLRARHRVGQAKFLEQPVTEWRSDGEAKLATRLRLELKRRGLA